VEVEGLVSLPLVRLVDGKVVGGSLVGLVIGPAVAAWRSQEYTQLLAL
jgi:hypothetical protein